MGFMCFSFDLDGSVDGSSQHYKPTWRVWSGYLHMLPLLMPLQWQDGSTSTKDTMAAVGLGPWCHSGDLHVRGRCLRAQARRGELAGEVSVLGLFRDTRPKSLRMKVRERMERDTR
jgi:hypothetical protein